ncbi:hypothetical protein MMC29_001650 [Sticta canariensis]|nr:hypothetical protein [Sticta canariensis]
MADNLRSSTKTSDIQGFTHEVSKEEAVLGDKAVGGTDDDADHVPNVERGLKAAISNPNTSTKAKNEAEEKLNAIS